ncbi:hypothetical protein ABH935_008593 [Catenulispora sp. GAS73]|uniref:hypothetical protein n=1 Tax=Catenulispora sp. GAS73 TaxID=3156269 RepID=UPI00351941C5
MPETPGLAGEQFEGALGDLRVPDAVGCSSCVVDCVFGVVIVVPCESGGVAPTVNLTTSAKKTRALAMLRCLTPGCFRTPSIRGPAIISPCTRV